MALPMKYGAQLIPVLDPFRLLKAGQVFFNLTNVEKKSTFVENVMIIRPPRLELEDIQIFQLYPNHHFAELNDCLLYSEEDEWFFNPFKKDSDHVNFLMLYGMQGSSRMETSL